MDTRIKTNQANSFMGHNSQLYRNIYHMPFIVSHNFEVLREAREIIRVVLKYEKVGGITQMARN